MAYPGLLGKSCGFSEASFYQERSVPKHATAHMCAESNERLKIVTQLFIRWWKRPTGVDL